MTRNGIEIISLLTSRNDYTSLKDLRVLLKISERSVRYEVDKANELLKFLELPQIEQNRKLGLKLVFNNNQKNKMLSYFEKTQNELHYYTSDERFLIILFSILDDSRSVFGNRLARILNVSKSTMDSDMKKIREYIEEYNLSIESIPKKGFKLNGNEKSIRLMMNNTINKFIDIERIIDYCDDPKMINKKEKVIIDFLNEGLILWTYMKLRDMNSINNFNISNVYCCQITIIFTIWIKRISNKHYLESEDFDIILQDKSYVDKIVSLFIEEVKHRYDIQINSYEKNYLNYLIDSFNMGVSQSLNIDWGGVQMLTLQFIEKMELETAIPFFDDKELFEKLYRHIEALLKRLKKKINLSNPLNNMVMEYYSDIFTSVKEAIDIIERYSSETISDDEISYIAIHFSASKEKLAKSSSRRYRVAVICGHGVATGELLAENLRKFYQFDIVGIVNSHNLAAIKELNADFAFRTVSGEPVNIPSLKINPFLSDYDRKKINKFLKQNPKVVHHDIPKFGVTEFFREICSISEKNSLKLNMEAFIQDLTSLFEKNRLTIDKKGVQPMISEVLMDKQILLKEKASSWEEAILLAAKPLLVDKYINENYVKAMIESVKKYGPYIVIGKGIALAHARPEDGVNKLGISILTLSEPISFGHDENDPVEIIFCLAAIDNFSHLRIMKSIVNLINLEWQLSKLIEQQSTEEFKKMIVEFEEE